MAVCFAACSRGLAKLLGTLASWRSGGECQRGSGPSNICLYSVCRLHQARGHPTPGHFSLAAAAEELWSAERALGALHTAAQWTHPAEKASAGAAHCRCPPLLLPPIAAARRRFCPYPLLCCLCRAAAILRWLPC